LNLLVNYFIIITYKKKNFLESLFRNEKAFQVLVSALLYPESTPNFHFDSLNVDSDIIPDIFRQKIVAAIAEVFKSNYLNYFLTESMNILPILIEHLDKFSSKIQVRSNIIYY
jgi:hypothetical protein